MYRPTDRFVWDFWLARNAGVWHLFHLQAPRSLDPDQRHWEASVGHATSTDLRSWGSQPTVVTAGPPGSWDDTAIWTGSIHRYDSRWWLMAYTGITREDGRIVERIGLAWSTDLYSWTKDPANPVLVSDPRWYEQPGRSRWQHGWRDPFIVRTATGWAMLISARVLGVAGERAGSLALATSPDAQTWTARPPIKGTSGYFAELEVPQLLVENGRRHLIFSARGNEPWTGRDGGCAGPKIGTYQFVGYEPFGPYVDPPLLVEGDRRGSTYGGRVIRRAAGDFVYMAFLDGGAGSFEGAISDPAPVCLDEVTGRLVPSRDARSTGGNGAEDREP